MYTLFFKSAKQATEFALSNNKAALTVRSLNAWTWEDDHTYHLATSDSEKAWFIAKKWMAHQFDLVTVKGNQVTVVRASF